MEKGIIIIGKPSSGKTTKANEIASKYNANEVVRIDLIPDLYFYYYSFCFSQCNKNTKLLIIENVDNSKIFNDSYDWISQGITVNKKFQDKFKINPQIIFECHSDLTITDLNRNEAFNHYYDVIECTGNYINREE